MEVLFAHKSASARRRLPFLEHTLGEKFPDGKFLDNGV